MQKMILAGIMVMVLAGCGGGGSNSATDAANAPVSKVSALEGTWQYTNPGSEKGWLDTTLLSSITITGATFRSVEPSNTTIPLAQAVSQGFINRSRDGIAVVTDNTLSISSITGNKGTPNEYAAASISYTFTLTGNKLVFNTSDGYRTFTKQ